MPIIKGFVDQIFEESDILIILTKENKRYSVPKNNTLGVIKSGDFVIFNGEKWYKDPDDLQIKEDLRKKILNKK